MKTTFFSKAVVLFCTTIFLFACSEIDNLILENEFVKKQEVSNPVDEETFVSLDKASEIADLFFSKLTEGNVSTRSSFRAERGSNSIEAVSERGSPLMYIINYPDGGFVIMGSSKNYYPILAYSDKNSFEIIPEMNGVAEWLEETKEAIKTCDNLDDSIKTGMQNLWKSYETADIVSSWETPDAQLRSATATSGEVACWMRCDELQMQNTYDSWTFCPLSNAKQLFENAGFLDIYNNLCFSAEYNHSPLNCTVVGFLNVYKNEQVGPLLTTHWSQGAPYNSLCDGHLAGCGAIALAQVMNYYQYPQSLSLNGYALDWTHISVPPISFLDRATLIRLVGGSINMHYDFFGSWTTPGDMETGIRFLGYNLTRASHNYNSVQTQLLTYKRPVIMLGNNSNLSLLPGSLEYIGNSHYWVCDGARKITTGQIKYFTEWQPNGNGVFTPGSYSINSPGVQGGISYLYFSMNWGWNGNFDGWFAFNDVKTDNGNYQYVRQDFYISKP